MSRSKPRLVKPAPWLMRWPKWVLILLVPLAVTVAVLWYEEHPQHLLREARTVMANDPARADALLERSISAASGDFPEAQLERCRLFAVQHRWLESLGCFSQIVNLRQCDARELLQLAKLALADRQNYLTELALDAARREGPEEAEVLRLSIPLHQMRGRFEKVVADCDRLAVLAPTDPTPWMVAGGIHQQGKEVHKAIAAFQAALERDPVASDLIKIRSALAELYLSEGNLTGARQQLERLRSLGTLSQADRLKWSYLLRLEGDFQGALTEVENLLTDRPENVRALELRGILKLDLGRPHEAVTDLEQVLRDEPHSVETHSKLGQAYQKLQRPDQAVPHLQRSRELVEFRIELLGVLSALNKDPSNLTLRQRAAELHDALGQPEAASKLRIPP